MQEELLRTSQIETELVDRSKQQIVVSEYVFDVDNFNLAVPWTPNIYFSVRGAENFHIYLWIAKDIGMSAILIEECSGFDVVDA